MAQSLRQFCRKTTSSAAVLITQLINTSDHEEKKEAILTIANLTLQDPPVTFLDDVVAVIDDPDVQLAVTNVLYRNRQLSNAKDQHLMQQQQILPPGGLLILQENDTDTEQPGECLSDEKQEEINEGYVRVITNENKDNTEIEEEIDKNVVEGIKSHQKRIIGASELLAELAEPQIISERVELKSISRKLLESLEIRLRMAFDWFCGTFNLKFNNYKLLKSNNNSNNNRNNRNNSGNNPNNNDSEDAAEYVNMVIFVGMVSILLMTAKVYHPRLAVEITTKLTILFQ